MNSIVKEILPIKSHAFDSFDPGWFGNHEPQPLYSLKKFGHQIPKLTLNNLKDLVHKSFMDDK